jgi:hypothetical protein
MMILAGVVYCLKCKEYVLNNILITYIGETGRPLGKQINEYLQITDNNDK